AGGVGAATWMVAGPMIARWWNRPAKVPVVYTAVESDVEMPEYTVLPASGGLESALTRVDSAAKASLATIRHPDADLSMGDRAAIARETAAALRPLLAGSREEYIAWLRATGAVHPVLDHPDSD